MNNYEYLYSIIDQENDDERLRVAYSDEGIAWASDGNSLHFVEDEQLAAPLSSSAAYRTAIDVHEREDVIKVVISSKYLQKMLAGGDVVELSIPINNRAAPIKAECFSNTISYAKYKTTGRFALIMPRVARAFGD